MRNVGCIYIVQNKKYMCNDRHEKRRNAARKRYKEGKIYAVAADYPLKQGLKRLFMFRLADPKKSCSGLSTKTRIETLRVKAVQYIPNCSCSGLSTKTRIETLTSGSKPKAPHRKARPISSGSHLLPHPPAVTVGRLQPAYRLSSTTPFVCLLPLKGILCCLPF